MKHYYRGRERIKVYQYDHNGKYIRSYETIAEARDDHYADVNGVYPMFRDNATYHLLPNNTILFKERTYRDQVVRTLRRIANPLVIKNDKDIKPFVVYNIDNEPIATFVNINTAVILTGMSYASIMSMLTKKKTDGMPHNELKIMCKWQTDE